jgi:hypothetical protein
MTWRGILAVLVAGFLLVIAGAAVYRVRVRASAQRLIDSASEIRSATDAEEQIAMWRNRSDRTFIEEEPLQDGVHSYDIQVENGLLHRLHVTAPAMVGMSITMHGKELRGVTLVMFTGRKPNTTAGIWVQEWFDSKSTDAFHVNAKDRPWRATVDFTSSIPSTQREKALKLNAECLISLRGCRSAEDILPGIWRLDANSP